MSVDANMDVRMIFNGNDECGCLYGRRWWFEEDLP